MRPSVVFLKKRVEAAPAVMLVHSTAAWRGIRGGDRRCVGYILSAIRAEVSRGVHGRDKICGAFQRRDASRKGLRLSRNNLPRRLRRPQLPPLKGSANCHSCASRNPHACSTRGDTLHACSECNSKTSQDMNLLDSLENLRYCMAAR